MASPYTPTPPDKQLVRLVVVDDGVELTRWTQYSFASNFLTPADGWSCTVADGHLAPDQKAALRIGARVELFVDEFPLATGTIDSVEIEASRQSGTTYSIHGRDRLGAVVDAVADPRTQFKDGATLAEFLKQLFGPFGWASDDQFEIDSSANRDAKTGAIRGTPTTTGKKGTKPLKDFKLHQLKSHNHEGLFRFAQRVTERFGLWIWCSADGGKLIINKPDFDQAPAYQLRRNYAGPDPTNILSGTVKWDGTDQPSIIVADGFSGGGEFGRGQIKSYCVNPYFGYDDSGFMSDEVLAVVNKYPEAKPVLYVVQPFPRRAPRMPPRPVFLHDEESKTQEQLDFFVKRTMSELLRKSLTCHYTVEGHGQTVNGTFVPWDIDRVVEVQDEVGGVNERMWIIGRTFEKSRSGGTFTKLELVRLYSIASGNQEELAAKPGLVSNTKPQRERRIREEQLTSIDTAAPRLTSTGPVFSRG
jgi:prophage tail gpP-like protein